VAPYRPSNPIRIVTAASLFDGHDASINIMRRIIQASGAEVIHLGHDRSVAEIVDCAIQEDANAVAVTCYQGGHLEFYKYLRDLLVERRCGHIRIFGGGGGTILPGEIEELQRYGITRIYHPDDGRAMGLQGMIDDLLSRCDFPLGQTLDGELQALATRDPRAIARLISAAENHAPLHAAPLAEVRRAAEASRTPVLGVTGTGGAGKSSVVDEVIRRFLADFPDKTVAVVAVDPSKRKTGGALLGDRIRMNAIQSDRVYMRSLATRQSNAAVSRHLQDALDVVRAAGFDLAIVETGGIGQGDTEIVEYADVTLYVMTPDFGAATQLEKIDMLDFADVVALNKFDKRGALDALRDVRKQYRRSRQRWDGDDESLPIFGTVAPKFDDPGMNRLYRSLMARVAAATGADLEPRLPAPVEGARGAPAIPPARVRYLAEIAERIRRDDRWAKAQSDLAQRLQAARTALETLAAEGRPEDAPAREALARSAARLEQALDPELLGLLEAWPAQARRYREEGFGFTVRGREVRISTHATTLSGIRVPKIATPRFGAWGDLLRWLLAENLPGEFPYTAGIYPYRREGEEPTRMFAGEGGPERTNRRFHFVSAGMPAKRLSTAFDSVTLYGHDPGPSPDVYGKLGNSGVSVCCLDDAKKLYSGFDLADPRTSVSMTINGPAPAMTAFFMNAAIDQQCERWIRAHGLEREVEVKLRARWEDRGLERPRFQGALPEGSDGLGLLLLGLTGDEVLPRDVYERIRGETLRAVRGTVQADILKEDQAQNTCIFSTEFALRLMGDVQQYFIDRQIRNFYSVSISGYHIAEAGANPITQLALTLSNGFTYVEHYLSRGMRVDDFAPNLSFFFSSGMDAEYAVLGRVARRIWARAMKRCYGANERSQKLKYHVQTSGRSLHAQEIAFNDIRTTLQALHAIHDNCNSLHTNAYDEAITTPTEASVRRAMAIQLVIQRELGLARSENPLQGAFVVEELTDLVEEAVLAEFDRISERGGVLGAMETMYQRGKIQEESLHYERLKHSGELPIVGVNTFLSAEGSPTVVPREVVRATPEEKRHQLEVLERLHRAHAGEAPDRLARLRRVATAGGNVFEELMETVKGCSLGQITDALFDAGGRYRRSM
jgi:methylmalonyl-CoA mutase